MKPKIFLDAGQFDGVAIKQYCIDDSWDIYSFEIDPKYPEGLPSHHLIPKAVWTEDGEIEVAIDPRQQASHIKGIIGGEWGETRTVPAVDFSRFVSELPEATIVCSMDIEGAEFYVLPKMIKDGTITRLAVLDIEFHHRFMSDFEADDSRKLIQEIDNLGVIVRLKIVLP